MCLMSIQFSISQQIYCFSARKIEPFVFNLLMYPSCKKALEGTKVQVTVTNAQTSYRKSAGALIKHLSTSLHFLTPSKITAKRLKNISVLQWDFVAHIHNQQQLTIKDLFNFPYRIQYASFLAQALLSSGSHVFSCLFCWV